MFTYTTGPQITKEELEKMFQEIRDSRTNKEYTSPKATIEHLEDNVNHPKHYTSHPSGIEVIQITEHMNFCRGNACKYLLRAGLKHKDTEIEDLRKAIWYINREIQRLEKESL